MHTHTARIVRFVVVAVAMALPLATIAPAVAQQPSVQYQFRDRSPPGAVGQARLQRGGPVVGYYQPVEITVPKDVIVSLADQGGWTEPTERVFAGMQIGVPYRIKLANLPEHFRNLECYPTIEIIDRTYAPVGLERKFPIPIVFNEDDLRLATEGMLVTRVVYIEDPQQALPGSQKPGDQLWFDAGTKADALEVADGLGRPVAIVRLGGRTPDESAGPDMQFLFGCPKWLRIMPPPTSAQLVPTPSSPPATVPHPTAAPLPLQNSSARRPAAR